MFVSRNLVALMTFCAAETLPAEPEPLLQTGAGRPWVGSFGAGSDNPVQPQKNELLQSGFPLRRHNFRPMQNALGQIDRRLHRLFIQVYGYTVNCAVTQELRAIQ